MNAQSAIANLDHKKSGPKGPRLGNSMPAAPRAKRWVFTINNPTWSDWSELLKLEVLCTKLCLQEEVGESGTPHIQGCFHLKAKKRGSALSKILNRAHFEMMRGTWEQAENYAQKLDTRAPGGVSWRVGLVPAPKMITQLYPWQKELVDTLDMPPDDRTILWFYDSAGGIGKTALCRMLVLTRGALIVGGTAKDVHYTIAADAKAGKPYPTIVILNLPRSSQNHLSYAGVESVKDGLFNSAKYESTMVIFNPPHMVIFANEEPEYDKLSADRWSVHNLNGAAKSPLSPIPPAPQKSTTEKTTGWELKLRAPSGQTGTDTVQLVVPPIPPAVVVDDETKSACSQTELYDTETGFDEMDLFDGIQFDLECDNEYEWSDSSVVSCNSV